MRNKVSIIDYGMGNINSVFSAVKFLGYDVIITNDRTEILSSNKIILPGVGEFGSAVKNLEKLNLFGLIQDIYKSKEIKILGICLGMQLLAESSEEGGFHKGLGIIPAKVKEIKKENNIRIPHIGFNEVSFPENSFLSACSQKTRDFYFVHSYCIYNDEITDGKLGLTEYGEKFVSLYEKDPIYATQFHPEKSQTNGLLLLKSFLDL
jgi:glutamine amidotransferase